MIDACAAFEASPRAFFTGALLFLPSAPIAVMALTSNPCRRVYWNDFFICIRPFLED